MTSSLKSVKAVPKLRHVNRWHFQHILLQEFKQIISSQYLNYCYSFNLHRNSALAWLALDFCYLNTNSQSPLLVLESFFLKGWLRWLTFSCNKSPKLYKLKPMLSLREFWRKAASGQSEFLPTAGCSLVMQMTMKELGGDDIDANYPCSTVLFLLYEVLTYNTFDKPRWYHLVPQTNQGSR